MGFDVYLRWPNQTEEERQAQYTGFSIVHGHVGYLREAYHGEPYATKVLVPEAFDAADNGEGGVPIPAAVLRQRLPKALAACKKRHTTIYKDSPDAIAMYQKAYIDFVELAERKEAELGTPISVVVS